MRGSQQNTHRSFALNTPFRWNYQVEKQPGRCCYSQREANRHSSLAGRDIDKTTALIPTDGGEQYLQQHIATLSQPEGEESSSLQVQRAWTFCRAVAWGLQKGTESAGSRVEG